MSNSTEMPPDWGETDKPQQQQHPAPARQPRGTLALLADAYLAGAGVDVLAGLVPAGVEQAMVANAFLATVAANPDLMTCTYQSLEQCLRDCARMGLLPGPAGHIYLIPRSGKAQAQVGYQGLIALMKRSAGVVRVETGAIHEHDVFVARRGSNPEFAHEPNWKGDRGEAMSWYAVAYFLDGGPPQFEIMTLAEIEAIRDAHGNKRLWAAHFEEKARITVVRRLAKWIGQDDALGHAFRMMDAGEAPAPRKPNTRHDAIRARLETKP